MTGFEKAGTRNVFRIRTNGLPSCPRNIREKYKIKEVMMRSCLIQEPHPSRSSCEKQNVNA